ncbi:MAG: SpoIIE family protein phosphatase [Planctomycetaceae bacterium]|nr:SpoIIE family protein phosphatase [Planctomycetaceae bacterium]
MAELLPDQSFWIKDTCRRLSSSTGWPIVFRAFDELPTQSPLPPGEYQHQEAGLIGGMLCVDLPGNYVEQEDWPAVKELVRLQAEFINRVISLENSRRVEDARRERLQKFLNLIAERGSPEENLPQLLDLACEVSESDGAAIFLLSTGNAELNLCAQTSRREMAMVCQRRPLGPDAPDVEASIKGPTEVLLKDSQEHRFWLPNHWEQGVCLTLRMGTQPAGSLWVYRETEKTVSQESLEFLEQIASVLSLELERLTLFEESRQRFRLKKEMTAATPPQLTRSLSPDLTQTLKIARRYESREELGGDLCKVVTIDDARSAILLGDATGDSIPAAMIRAHAEGAIQYSLMHSEIDPTETDLLMENINRSLCELLPADQFFSLFLGIWNERTRELSCTNAGHPPPLLLRNGRVSVIKSHGMLLGILKATRYHHSTFKLLPGDQLIVYSDGVSESISLSRYQSVQQLVVRAFTQERYRYREALADLIWETALFADEREDDRSLLILEIDEESGVQQTSLSDQRVDPDHSPKFHNDPHGQVLPPDSVSFSYDRNRDIVSPQD